MPSPSISLADQTSQPYVDIENPEQTNRNQQIAPRGSPPGPTAFSIDQGARVLATQTSENTQPTNQRSACLDPGQPICILFAAGVLGCIAAAILTGRANYINGYVPTGENTPPSILKTDIAGDAKDQFNELINNIVQSVSSRLAKSDLSLTACLENLSIQPNFTCNSTAYPLSIQEQRINKEGLLDLVKSIYEQMRKVGEGFAYSYPDEIRYGQFELVGMYARVQGLQDVIRPINRMIWLARMVAAGSAPAAAIGLILSWWYTSSYTS